jgi:hypothetical protein
MEIFAFISVFSNGVQDGIVLHKIMSMAQNSLSTRRGWDLSLNRQLPRVFCGEVNFSSEMIQADKTTRKTSR